MVNLVFPDPDQADETGLLTIGGDLSLNTLLKAYRSGIFPWPVNEHILTWFCPPTRAILPLKDFHVARSLRKQLKQSNFEFSFDKSFDEVISSCAELDNRSGQLGTWIIPDIQDAYKEFHRAGYAHSVECWKSGKLVGGLYGVSIGMMFAGESMFYRTSGASKAALIFLVEHLKTHGVEWIDCQVMTPLFRSFGAIEIDRDDFLTMLAETLSKPGKLF